MTDKIVHLRLDEKRWRKLDNAALLSRRTQQACLRILIDDMTVAQLGVRQPEEEKPA